MHEFELGVWKSVFMHLMSNVPSFGRSTICKFHNNASAMKKLAARDFEDLLQVVLPFFFNSFLFAYTI